MLFFGHTGLTIASVIATDFLLYADRRRKQKDRDIAEGITVRELPYRYPKCTFVKKLDLRLVIIGSMLPDLIDKPLGIYLMGNTLSNGRVLSHTLVFLLVMSLD